MIRLIGQETNVRPWRNQYEAESTDFDVIEAD